MRLCPVQERAGGASEQMPPPTGEPETHRAADVNQNPKTIRMDRLRTALRMRRVADTATVGNHYSLPFSGIYSRAPDALNHRALWSVTVSQSPCFRTLAVWEVLARISGFSRSQLLRDEKPDVWSVTLFGTEDAEHFSAQDGREFAATRRKGAGGLLPSP